MSRGQSSSISNTATGNSSTDQANAASSLTGANNAIGNYQSQLASYVSDNPYTPGGEYDQTINAGLANTSNAASNSLKGALQSQSLRTGQNSAADAATAASGAEANEQNLSSQEATAQQGRISDEANYNQQALSVSAEPISAESSLYGTSLSGGNSAESTAETASAASPSFWDEVGSAIPAAAGAAAGAAARGCWIAAELYGGWYEPRTVLVRHWLHTKFRERAVGRFVVKVYMRYGERTAKLVRDYPALKRLFLPIFNAALRRAREYEAEFTAGADLGRSGSIYAQFRAFDDFESKLLADADQLIRSKISSRLSRNGYRAGADLVLAIAHGLVRKFRATPLIAAHMDELKKLPIGPKSRRRRLALIDGAADHFLPGIVREELRMGDK